MLIGMHMGNRSKAGRASVGVGEIDERIRRNAVAARGRGGNSAFVQIHRAGIEVGDLSVRDRGQLQIEGLPARFRSRPAHRRNW